jgi:hypothetical protein
MGFFDTLLGVSVIILTIIGTIVKLIRTHMFDKVDPERNYHRVNLRGMSFFDQNAPEVPLEMVKINKISNIITFVIFTIFGLIALITVISKLM